MSSSKLVFLAVMLAGGLMAQVPGVSPPTGIIGVPPVPSYQLIQDYLGLTADQVTQLEQIRTTENTSQQSIFQQIATKQQQINALLQSNSTDAQTIGQLTIDINQLRQQLVDFGKPFHTQALAILTAAQQAKLVVLSDALKLQQTAWQAETLNLLDPPNVRIAFPGIPIPLTAAPQGIGSTVTQQ